MNTNQTLGLSGACTLQPAELTARIGEFDDLFASALRGQERLSPTTLRWRLDPAAEQTARGLTGREQQCCSFFTFTYSIASDGALLLDIAVPPAQSGVLGAMADRAAAATGS